jgi:hypothetical protein
MTTAFQTVIDNAEAISFNRRKKVAQTTSRDGTVKSTSLGGQIWEFEVTLPNGPKWSEYRPLIEKMEALDRITVGTIQINKAAHSWLTGYQGSLSSLSGIGVTFTSGNTVTITSGATGLSAGQFRFKSGDLIQLGSSGKVYSVVDDVIHNGTTITLNRPVREAAGSYTLVVGQSVTWSVICVQFPKWTVFARDQVGWDGPFVFAEAV